MERPRHPGADAWSQSVSVLAEIKKKSQDLDFKMILYILGYVIPRF